METFTTLHYGVFLAVGTLYHISLCRAQQNKRVLKEKVKEFSLKCRGFHGTMYAADTI